LGPKNGKYLLTQENLIARTVREINKTRLRLKTGRFRKGFFRKLGWPPKRKVRKDARRGGTRGERDRGKKFQKLNGDMGGGGGKGTGERNNEGNRIQKIKYLAEGRPKSEKG